jgi:uncharacterized repeat protein (TIGR01451 family)
MRHGVRILCGVALLCAGLALSGPAVSGRLAFTFPGFVTKSHAPSTGTPASNLTYSLGVSNTDATTTIVAATIVDDLPTGLTAQSASPGCQGTTRVTCSAGDVLPGKASPTFTIVVRPSTAGTYTNSAFATGNTCFSDTCIATSPTTTDVATVSVPTISIADVSVAEGNTGKTNAVFTVTLSKASGQTVTVAYATANGTATAGSDYDATTGTLTFPPGTTSQQISVPVTGDTVVEPDETFTVGLTGPGNATLARAQATGTIRNDDSAPDLALTGNAPAGVLGTNFAYTLTATNPGPAAATGVKLTATLSPDVSFVSTSSSTGTCSGTGPVACDLGSLAAGASATVTITVKPEHVRARVTSTAQLTATEQDPNAGNNSVTVTNAVALPPPVPGKTENVAPTRGTVTVKLPGSSTFVPLTGPKQIPTGATIDTTNGAVTLTSSEGSSLFYAGKFTVGELKANRGGTRHITVAILAGGSFAACPKVRKAKRAPAAADARVIRRLWSNAKGRFRTKGRFASAAVRGTLWVTEDRCDGTLTRVRRGVVAVTDLKTKKTVIVRAGRSYLAKA